MQTIDNEACLKYLHYTSSLPMDLTQIVLLSVIIVLAVFLMILGAQLFFVLKDLRRSLHRMNRFFDDANQLVEEVKKPIEKAGTFVTALTTASGIINLLKKGKK